MSKLDQFVVGIMLSAILWNVLEIKWILKGRSK